MVMSMWNVPPGMTPCRQNPSGYPDRAQLVTVSETLTFKVGNQHEWAPRLPLLARGYIREQGGFRTWAIDGHKKLYLGLNEVNEENVLTLVSEREFLAHAGKDPEVQKLLGLDPKPESDPKTPQPNFSWVEEALKQGWVPPQGFDLTPYKIPGWMKMPWEAPDGMFVICSKEQNEIREGVALLGSRVFVVGKKHETVPVKPFVAQGRRKEDGLYWVLDGKGSAWLQTYDPYAIVLKQVQISEILDDIVSYLRDRVGARPDKG